MTKFGWVVILVGAPFLSCSPGMEKQRARVDSAQEQMKIESKTIEFFSSPSEEPFEAMKRVIGKANTDIRLFAFHLTDEGLVNSLIQAKQRGVRVRIIAERKSFFDPRTNRAMDMLHAVGVEIIKHSRGFSILHAKSFVIDTKFAVIGTMNMHKTSKEFVDFGVVTSDQEIISELISVFETDWRNAEDGQSKTPTLKNKNLLFSPVNAKSKLISLIQSANKEILIGVENLSHPEILQAIENKHAQGVHIRILTPECTIGAKPAHNIEAIKKLRGVGIEAKVLPRPSSSGVSYWHAKTIIIDHKKIYLGSENITENSLERAREVGIILEDLHIISNVRRVFEKFWSLGFFLDEDYVFSGFWCK